ncbi:hypothetical protein CCACVL1_28102 [Corchorus capsularis]|uniref:Uncharacterized protein n=1 Tax=Corchorus capsularis TaxID=210143 RepID=A0A1R3G7M9_COCAP|nr:hypothetical protein CCACVL1_28102 [Corchorus capsularis]
MASKQATVASALVIICLIVLSSDIGGVKCQTPGSNECHFITANCQTNGDCTTICTAQGYSRGACANFKQCCCITSA